MDKTMEDSPISFSMCPRSSQPRMDQKQSSPADSLPELTEPTAKSDIEKDDSSKVLNRLFVNEEKQFSSETLVMEPPLGSSTITRRYTERKIGQRWESSRSFARARESGSFVRPHPEVPVPVSHTGASGSAYDSDIDTDDSSKVLNRLFKENMLYAYDPTPSIENKESRHFVVSANTISNLGLFHNKGHSYPNYMLEVSRSLFEERLKVRESELLKMPATCRLLAILSETILSPVSTLLVKLNAPNEWKTCESCEGFLQTHCCLKSQKLQESTESNKRSVLGFRRLPSRSDEANGAYVPYNGVEDDEEDQSSSSEFISFQ